MRQTTTGSTCENYPSCSINERKIYKCCLERNLRVELEDWNFLGPRLELLGLGVDVVVEDCSLARELDRLELVDPPAREFYAPVGELLTHSHAT